MSDSTDCAREAAQLEKVTAAFRTGKKLSKQEVVEEPYDGGVCSHIGSEERDVTAFETRVLDRSEKTEPPQTSIRTIPPKSLSSRPKLLVRSQALCGEDDTQYGLRFSGLPTLGNTSRSSASSLSRESSLDIYTDSTGIDLQSFIVNTLHKNQKDRQMLLELEKQMTALINDTSRNSLKLGVMSSYNRMLVHRVAAFFGMDHNVDQTGTAVVVNKNPQTRIPAIEFSSLIRGDTFTDEPRRYLKRNVQSYEEGRQQCLGSNLMADRRAHSFDVSECATGNTMPPNCQLPGTPVQLLESPGSCYSYGEVQSMGVRPPLDGNAMYSGYPMPQVYSWNNSENFGTYNPGVELPPNVIASSVSTPNRAPMLGATRNIKKAASIDTERSLHNSVGAHLAGEQRTTPLRRSMTDRHRPDLLSVHEPSIPEHRTVPSSVHDACDFTMSAVPSPTWQQTPVYDTSRIESSSSNQYFMGPQYAPTQQFVQCVPPNLPTACADLQRMTQQMDALCVNESPEVPSPQQVPQVYTYQLPPQVSNASFPQQVQIPSSMCPPQSYFVSVLPQGYVVANAQQPALCRFTQPPPNHNGREYPTVQYPGFLEPIVTKNNGTIPTGAVDQL